MNAKRRLLCAPLLLIAACSTTLEGNNDCAALIDCVGDAAMGPTLDLAAPLSDLAMPPSPDLATPLLDLAIPMLDLHQVTVYDNPENVADWPVTTMITRLDIQPSGVHLEFSKQDGADRWPDIVPPGWDGPLQYTVGIVMNIGGKWYGSAAIQYWYGLHESGGNVAEPGQIPNNWYYDGRWGKLQGYQPKPGELIGFFVVAGNVRGVKDGSQSPQRERSNIVLVRLPGPAGGSYTF